ncbi:GNAT family N-acetyltransferase [Paeniglutamicibacter cryotolerans]|uniref:Putative acetyltransferase n=1 Tax=Paeniglutamicibacter cryotolerans TaxID=670079 RepID=A0A839QI07_9MICC|nr:GNAT family N-acetyltransferase [Paeniglutamicibacter cryotolerans]MBB2994374.1 putative acetyltransferase [Paeniglutamicibacter cryotolerans]
MLILRGLLPGDREQALAAHAELARENVDFLLDYDVGVDWAGYLALLSRQHGGIDLPAGRVPADLLAAVQGDDIVGRVSIRYELNDMLALIGGHLGYAVRPGYRRRGHAGRIMALALPRLAARGIDSALVTCAADNVASRKAIEGAGGAIDGEVELLPGYVTLRYRVPTA